MNKPYIKKVGIPIVVVIAAIAGLFFFIQHKSKSGDKEFEMFEEGEEGEKAFTDANEAADFEFMMTKDPKTGRIPVGIRDQEMSQARAVYARQISNARVLANAYAFQGPDNLGGRTRSIAYDVRFDGTSNQTILAGGVSGGVYKSIDNGATWVRKSPTNQLYSVTCIAQDPRPGFQNTWYYATGEPLGNSASSFNGAGFYCGFGIFKSTDNGETWSRLPNSNTGALENFDRVQDFILKIAVNPTNGDLYMASISTILRSQDGGSTWGAVLSGAVSNSAQVTDIAITTTGRLYAAFSGFCSNTVDGVWTSTTGAPGSWTRIAGTGAATNPSGWNAQGAYGRTVLAIAPSNENLVYALYDNNFASKCATAPGAEAELYQWDQSATTWTNLSAQLPDETGCSDGNDPFAVQAGYDMVMGVKPDDENVVFIGGTNIYRSTDAFATAANVTRIGGYANASGYGLYPNSHSDIHAIAFQPGSPSVMLCGNDGGIQRTSDNLGATVAWTPVNSGYTTYQYYSVAIDPRSGNTKVIGGAQDNGTTRNIGGAGTSFEQVYSGDGVSVGLSNVIASNTYEYCGSQQGSIVRRNSTSALGSVTNIRPSTALNRGLFVTLFRLDPDNTEYIYYASDSSLYRNTSASTALPSNWTNLTGVSGTAGEGTNKIITALATTRGTYNASTASLFIGTSNGKVYRLDDPANTAAATAPVNITGASFVTGGFVSSIAVNPRNDDTVVVTFSNYNVTSVWWTGNANSASPTWQNVEGNLSLPSYRSATIAVTASGVEYFVGTSVGLYKATIDGANPAATTWTQEGPTDMGNAVVASLALRTADNTLLVGTHGYGMWKTQLSLTNLPLTFRSFTGKEQPKYNDLFWETENEQNNKGFSIERRYEGDPAFTSIGFVSGKNGTNLNSYTYRDLSVDLGKQVAYYRLKQIDLDGKPMISPVVSLSRATSGKWLEYVSVTGHSLYMRINGSNSNETMQMNLFDMTGKLLKKSQLPFQSQTVDISTLPAGVYVMRLTLQGHQTISQKIVKH